jgi:hypothetical protein
MLNKSPAITGAMYANKKAAMYANKKAKIQALRINPC